MFYETEISYLKYLERKWKLKYKQMKNVKTQTPTCYNPPIRKK